MLAISKKFQFDSAHQLWDDELSTLENEELFGKCSRIHGHTYSLEVAVTGEVDPVSGMILNYFLLDAIVRPIVDRLDHQNLNTIFEGLTTAENMVRRIAVLIEEELSARYDNIFLTQVTLQETPKTKAVYRP
jgi:6-pyruvoyltetrahydropterin/6-carboxytetrahydropterin synthase